MGEDHGAALAEILVSAGMVAMPMSVDDEADGIAVERRDRGGDLVGQRRELIVDDDVAVFAIGQADIAACAEQDGDAGRETLDLDLDLVEILCRGGRGEERSSEGKSKSAHVNVPRFYGDFLALSQTSLKPSSSCQRKLASKLSPIGPQLSLGRR